MSSSLFMIYWNGAYLSWGDHTSCVWVSSFLCAKIKTMLVSAVPALQKARVHGGAIYSPALVYRYDLPWCEIIHRSGMPTMWTNDKAVRNFQQTWPQSYSSCSCCVGSALWIFSRYRLGILWDKVMLLWVYCYRSRVKKEFGRNNF